MEFMVSFVFKAESPKAAAKVVEGWRVSKGAVLTQLQSAQPIQVIPDPVHIEDGVVPKLTLAKAEHQPSSIPPSRPSLKPPRGVHRPLVGLGDHISADELEERRDAGAR